MTLDGDQDDDDEVEFVPETDTERRQALLASEHEYASGRSSSRVSGADNDPQSKMGSGAAWKSMQDDFNFSGTPVASSSGTSTSQTRTRISASEASGGCKGKTKLGSKSQTSSDVIDISSDEGEKEGGDQDADDSCDLPIASGSTFTTHPYTSQSQPKRSTRTPTGPGLRLGKMVQTEMELRRKEALGMAPVKGGGRTLGATPAKASTKMRRDSPMLTDDRTMIRRPQKKHDGVESPEGRWTCLVCTL